MCMGAALTLVFLHRQSRIIARIALRENGMLEFVVLEMIKAAWKNVFASSVKRCDPPRRTAHTLNEILATGRQRLFTQL